MDHKPSLPGEIKQFLLFLLVLNIPQLIQTQQLFTRQLMSRNNCRHRNFPTASLTHNTFASLTPTRRRVPTMCRFPRAGGARADAIGLVALDAHQFLLKPNGTLQTFPVVKDGQEGLLYYFKLINNISMKSV